MDDSPGLLAYQHERLANGLEVILHPDPRVPLVAVSIWYHVGGGHERSGQSGFAHLYEHLFKNSKHLGDRHHYAILRAAGSVAANARTGRDRTEYYEILPAHELPLALWIESDRMGYFLPGLSQQRLDRQIDVVRNERRQRYENVAYGLERFAIAEALYPVGHPYRYLTIGKHEDIASATLAEVERFYRTWYVPANATLAIAGSFELAHARDLVDKWFGSFPTSTCPDRRIAAAPPLTANVRLELCDPLAKLRRLHLVWQAPGAFGAGQAELSLAAHILGASGTGRLYRRLVHEQRLAQRVRVSNAVVRGSGELHVVIDASQDASLAQIESIVADELTRLGREPVTARELERALARREAAILWGLERVSNRLSWLQYYNHHTSDPGFLSRDMARYRSVTADSLQAQLEAIRNAPRVEVTTLPAD